MCRLVLATVALAAAPAEAARGPHLAIDPSVVAETEGLRVRLGPVHKQHEALQCSVHR